MKTTEFIDPMTGRAKLTGWIRSSDKLPENDELVLIRKIGQENFTVGKIYPLSEGPFENAWKCVDVIFPQKNTEWISIQERIK